MIDEIQVRDVALIREATLAPSPGLTVITGETGAGKTALLASLKLLMGVRASSDMVRDGADGLAVSGRFYVGEGHAEEVVATRKVSADGRSRATVNGEMASMHELADAIAPSVDLCGQFEHQQLMKPANHLALLDDWARDEIAAPLDAYQRAFARAQAAAAELARVREAGALSAEKLEDARFVLRRIDGVSPQEGEYDQLKHDLALAENAEALAMASAGAHESLVGDGGVLDSLDAAASALEAGGRFDAELLQLASSLREVGYVVQDVAASSRAYRDSIEFDPEVLAAQQERFSQLQGLLRAYGPRMEDVMARRAEAADIVSLVDDSALRLRAAQKEADEAEQALAQAADALDAARAGAAPRFAEAVGATMAHLEMGSAHLACKQERLDRKAWTTAGPSSFEFLYSPGAGIQPRPFVRIASGGEVSRVMLAVKVALGAHDQVDTLVFDEVDAGVGGATAVALAEVIADLAKTHQVLVVTHLAQVAVHADVHYAVQRAEGDAGTETRLFLLDDEQRVAEIARMLSGHITDASLAHARELLG